MEKSEREARGGTQQATKRTTVTQLRSCDRMCLLVLINDSYAVSVLPVYHDWSRAGRRVLPLDWT